MTNTIAFYKYIHCDLAYRILNMLTKQTVPVYGQEEPLFCVIANDIYANAAGLLNDARIQTAEMPLPDLQNQVTLKKAIANNTFLHFKSNQLSSAVLVKV